MPCLGYLHFGRFAYCGGRRFWLMAAADGGAVVLFVVSDRMAFRITAIGTRKSLRIFAYQLCYSVVRINYFTMLSRTFFMASLHRRIDDYGGRAVGMLAVTQEKTFSSPQRKS
ncbi:MAG: hypothetical protein ACSLEM_01945 [Candidatus Malihini olakiniferum]